jgi:hypothetical protein
VHVPRNVGAALAAVVVVMFAVFALRSGGSGADGLPVVSVSKVVIDQIEGNSGVATVTVVMSLSAQSTSTVTASYATADGTAKISDSDYVATTGTAIFSPGETSQTLAVSVRGDTKLEDYETLKVKLSAPVNAILGNASETVQILNDEKPKLSMANVNKVDEGQSATFKPHLLQRYYQPITLNARTIDGTAVAPGDYDALDAPVTFPAGSNASVATSVHTIADGVPEGAEKLSLAVTGSGVVAGVTKTATITSQLCVASSAPSTYAHVVIVVMENKKYSSVVGAATAPFQTSLAKSCASANHYAQAASPSRPNTYIVPDLCNDSHDCSVAVGDQWLQTYLEPILASTEYLAGSTAVLITYDEYTPLPNMFVSRSARPGTVVTATTSHYALLRTIEDMLGLNPLGQASTATGLRNATGV